jgi:hypothetical protein
MAKVVVRQWQALVLKEDHWGRPIIEMERDLRKLSPDAILWFPAVTPQGDHDPDHPFASYIFVRPPVDPILVRARFIERLLAGLMDEKELRASVSRPRPIELGDSVTVVSGSAKGAWGVISRLKGPDCYIEIPLESGTREIRVLRSDVKIDDNS